MKTLRRFQAYKKYTPSRRVLFSRILIEIRFLSYFYQIFYSLLESGIITGWGTKREEEISLQEKLQKATVKLIHSNEECRSLTEGFNVTIEETVVCMTSPSQSNSSVDSCTGDQGGPLVFYENDVPVLAGLISYGIGIITSQLLVSSWVFSMILV